MSVTEYKEQMKQNRSTLYHYFKDTGLDMKMLKIGKGVYKVFQVPYDWEMGYLTINSMRITDFQAVILFTNELVVRFSTYEDVQINIPYKSIEYIKVEDGIHIGYQGLHLNKNS